VFCENAFLHRVEPADAEVKSRVRPHETLGLLAHGQDVFPVVICVGLRGFGVKAPRMCYS
jgi:hypothetical protein